MSKRGLGKKDEVAATDATKKCFNNRFILLQASFTFFNYFHFTNTSSSSGFQYMHGAPCKKVLPRNGSVAPYIQHGYRWERRALFSCY